MSQRTDLANTQAPRNIPASYYGEGKELSAVQSGAPMYATPPPTKPVGLFDHTQRPDEPITSGIDMGPGLGSSAVGQPPSAPYIPAPDRSLTATLRELAQIPGGDAHIGSLLRRVEGLGW